MKLYQIVGAYALGALSMAGCGEDASNSQLENKVEAQAMGLRIAEGATLRSGRLISPESKVEQELDLSTPEKFVQTYILINNRAWRGEIKPEETITRLCVGYSHIDLEDQKATLEKAQKFVRVEITGYDDLQVTSRPNGEIEVVCVLEGEILDLQSNKKDKKRDQEIFKLKKVGGKYKRTTW